MAATPPAISTGTAIAAGAGVSTAAPSSRAPAAVASRRKGSMRASRTSDQRPAADPSRGRSELDSAERQRGRGRRPPALAEQIEDQQGRDTHLPDDHQGRCRAQPPDARVAHGVRSGWRGRRSTRALAQPDPGGCRGHEHGRRQRVQRSVQAEPGRQRRQGEGGEGRPRRNRRLTEAECQPSLITGKPARTQPDRSPLWHWSRARRRGRCRRAAPRTRPRRRHRP